VGEASLPSPDVDAPPGRPCPLCGDGDGETVAISGPHLAPDRGERFRWVRCPSCRLVRLAEPPDEGETKRYYGPSYLPHRGPDAWGRWAPFVRRAGLARDRTRVRWALEALRTGARHGSPAGDGPLRTLDVGCGRPTFLRALRDATGSAVVGIDTHDQGWREEGKGEDGRWEGLELQAGPLDAFSFSRDAFHLITLWHVLEHVDEPRALLERLGAWAAPDAAIVVEVPDHASLPRRLQGASWIGYDTPRHRAAYESETLRRILEETGWRVVELRRRGTLDPWVLWWLGHQVARGRTLEGSLEGAFLPFLAGKALSAPVAALERWLPLGAMTAFGRKTREPPGG